MSQCGSDGCGKASIPVADLRTSNLSVFPPSGTRIFSDISLIGVVIS